MPSHPITEYLQYVKQASDILLDAFIPARARLYGRDEYAPAQAVLWLGNLARYLHTRSDESLSGTDIVLDQCWPIAGAARVQRWHTTVSIILTVVAGTALAILRNSGIHQSLSNLRYFLTNFPYLPRFFLVQGLALAAIFIFASWWAALAAGGSVKPRPINIQQLRTYQGRKRLAGGLAGGILGTVLIGIPSTVAIELISGFVGGLRFALEAGLLGGIIWGSLVGALDALAPRQNAVASDPRNALRSDLATGLVTGTASGLGLGLLIGLRAGLVAGLVVGAAAGALCGLVYLSVSSLRYLIAVSIASNARLLPLRFGRFMQWAYHAGILRISGNAYQFRHNELRDWLSPSR